MAGSGKWGKAKIPSFSPSHKQTMKIAPGIYVPGGYFRIKYSENIFMADEKATLGSVETELTLASNSMVKGPFCFHCHSEVSCYKDCCRQLDLYLYPYDIVRLKNKLQISSAEFMRSYTRLAAGSHDFFPAVMLLMSDNDEHTCPFLGEKGCLVYHDRPTSCRTYPLERAVEKKNVNAQLNAYYFMTQHEYCQGHFEEQMVTVQQWERSQQLYDFNLMNDYWAELDAFFSTNPWCGEGSAGPRQKLAFMICYNIDDFRDYCLQNRLVEQFRIDKDRRRRIKRDDAELLKFGFDWLQYILGERPTLRPR